MKSLSEPAFAFVSRRELLQNYFQHHPVPEVDPGGALTVQVDLGGSLFKESRTAVAYSFDEVMHVLAEMKLKGIPYETAEEVQRRNEEKRRAEIAALRWRYEMMQRVDEEVTKLVSMPADYGTLKDAEPTKRDDSAGFFRRAASKLFGKV